MLKGAFDALHNIGGCEAYKEEVEGEWDNMIYAPNYIFGLKAETVNIKWIIIRIFIFKCPFKFMKVRRSKLIWGEHIRMKHI